MLWVTALLLFQSGSDSEVRALIGKLKSERIEERNAAFERLKQLGEEAVPHLERAALDLDPEVAARAKRLLAVIKIRKSLTPGLLKALPGIADRLAAGGLHTWTEVMLEIGGYQGKDYLLQRNGKEGGEPGLPVLRATDLELLARRALQGAGTAEEKSPLLRIVSEVEIRAVIPEVILLLKDQDPKVRGDAALCLTRLRVKEAVPDIAELLTDKGHWLLRQVACQYLAELGAKERIPEIRRRLLENMPEIRRSAASALGRLKAVEAVGDLETLARGDPDESVRRAAADALREIKQR